MGSARLVNSIVTSVVPARHMLLFPEAVGIRLARASQPPPSTTAAREGTKIGSQCKTLLL